jgi:hypothetical protein
MQIDFHHATTYVVARDAGFSHNEADIIAYCSQYVDDATSSGAIYFDNGVVFNRISSAHKMFDYRNLAELANHFVWIPFHFLPGNGGLPAGQDPHGGFINKLVCKPNSPIAQEMVRDAILEKSRPYGLHRLGVTMHVYADTWAHQGFAGVSHRINDIRTLDAMEQQDENFIKKLKDFFQDKFDDTKSEFVGNALPLGHGAALSYPDRPFLQWAYRDSDGKKVVRDNTSDFLDAAEHMCIAMRRYRLGDPNADVPGLTPATRQQIADKFTSITLEDGEERHKQWLEALRKGEFTVCGKIDIDDYFSRGEDSWKADALGSSEDMPELYKHPYRNGFLRRPWTLFHEALQAHRFNVLYNILPKYDICAA